MLLVEGSQRALYKELADPLLDFIASRSDSSITMRVSECSVDEDVLDVFERALRKGTWDLSISDKNLLDEVLDDKSAYSTVVDEFISMNILDEIIVDEADRTGENDLECQKRLESNPHAFEKLIKR